MSLDLVEVEAKIMGTAQSSVYVRNNGLQYSASKLLDGLSLDGRFFNEDGCAATNENEITKWFSLELDVPRIVTKVQIARRMDHSSAQGNNVTITIGPSSEYDPNESLCRPEIPKLELQSGLVDYVCTEGPTEGQYVKISSPLRLCICEAKVFVQVEGKQTTFLVSHQVKDIMVCILHVQIAHSIG